MTSLTIRKSARLIILNQADEVFLFHHQDQKPANPEYPVLRRYWVTPGGGLEPGETWEAAAIRELWEETGISGVALGPCIWTRIKDAPMFGEMMRGIERYFVVRVADVAIVNDNQLDYERDVYQEHRWWPLNELAASDETFYPEGLAALLEPIVAGDFPASPIALPPEYS